MDDVTANQPNSYTWFMILFYFTTDLWLLILTILAVKELIGDPYIYPLGWAIALPVVSFLVFLVWTWIYGSGIQSKRMHSRHRDLTSMNFTDYFSWTSAGFLSLLLHFISISIATILYVSRFGLDRDIKTSQYFVSNEASRVWILSCLLVVATVTLVTLFFHLIASWKYWSLVWSCGDRSVFKNPFYPQKSVIFQTSKQ